MSSYEYVSDSQYKRAVDQALQRANRKHAQIDTRTAKCPGSFESVCYQVCVTPGVPADEIRNMTGTEISKLAKNGCIFARSILKGTP